MFKTGILNAASFVRENLNRESDQEGRMEHNVNAASLNVNDVLRTVIFEFWCKIEYY